MMWQRDLGPQKSKEKIAEEILEPLQRRVADFSEFSWPQDQPAIDALSRMFRDVADAGHFPRRDDLDAIDLHATTVAMLTIDKDVAGMMLDVKLALKKIPGYSPPGCEA